MHDVFAVTYDVKVHGLWQSADNPNGWGSQNIVAGDAEDAVTKFKRWARGRMIDAFTKKGQIVRGEITLIKAMKVERVATNVVIP